LNCRKNNLTQHLEPQTTKAHHQLKLV